MKISYVSDLHLDFHVPFVSNQIKWQQRTEDFIEELALTDEGEKDILVIAGDVSHFNKQSMWAISLFAKYYNHVLVTYGNHDLYLISNNQENKYKNHSQYRLDEFYTLLTGIENVHPLFTDKTFTYKSIVFGGNPLWYPLETAEQQTFFCNISNDSKLIKGFNIQEEYHHNQAQYENLLDKKVNVMISHVPVIYTDSHYKYNSTSCYLSHVKDIEASHWISGHIHEQKVYDKQYCTFYMNAIGYPEEGLKLSIESFEVQGGNA